MSSGHQRDGETALPFDPGALPADAGVVFIGHVNSPWSSRAECPKNMNAARESGQGGAVIVAEPYRAGLAGLAAASHIIILSWFHQSARDLIIQKPRHAPAAKGVFALRSPVRPNPVGLHVARLLSVDPDRGRLELDAIDLLNGTPVLDIKPYYASSDAFPDAARPE